MRPEAFEQLVSDWLDDPQSSELRARVEAAIASDPQFARLRAEFVRLDALIRTGLGALPPVAWDCLKARICAQIAQLADAADKDAHLDERLRSLPGIEQHVDWRAYQRKVAHAVARDAARPRLLRLSPWRLTVAAGAIAAAAAVILMLGRPLPTPSATRPRIHPGHASMIVLPQSDLETAESARAGVARMEIIENDEPQPARLADTSEPEVFFMLEPPDVALTMASTGGFGSP